MYVIGLTGGSGSGKSTVAEIFRECGVPVFSADALYRRITSCDSACCRELEREFGDILTESGALDRRRLFKLVFMSDERASRVETLNRITHKYVIAEFENELQKLDPDTARFAVFDAPLLVECGYDKKCVAVVSVLADREVRIERLMRRDSLDRDSVCARLNAQKKDIFYIRAADYIIYNNGDIESLRDRVRSIVDRVTERLGD